VPGDEGMSVEGRTSLFGTGFSGWYDICRVPIKNENSRQEPENLGIESIERQTCQYGINRDPDRVE